MVVDALFGTGLERAGRRACRAAVIDAINAQPARRCSRSTSRPVSSADTGRPLGTAVRADRDGDVRARQDRPVSSIRARDYAGRLEVVDIGIPADGVAARRRRRRELLERATVGRAAAAARRATRTRERFGHVLVVAGSRGKIGAALLAAEAAARAGRRL